MEIHAQINRFKPYSVRFEPKPLQVYQLEDIVNGTALKETSFLLNLGTNTYAISRWKGPKRSRTYPYPLVYDTIPYKLKVALIPFVKDEGRDGDRDFLQWDTISLMTLLGVHVITTYYTGAKKSSKLAGRQKITDHRLDYPYIAQRLEELSNYPSDHIHWNRQEISDYLPHVIDKTLEHYPLIEQQTGVPLKSINRILRRKALLKDFETASRRDAVRAQRRESQTMHRGERSTAGLKAIITIKNFLNGTYYFTVDEAILEGNTLFLIEKKHGEKGFTASTDIKDGLLKLMLYRNIEEAVVEDRLYNTRPVLGLTSDSVTGYAHSLMQDSDLSDFIEQNNLPDFLVTKLLNLFEEANENGLIAYLVNSDTEVILKSQMLSEFGRQ
jgi:hypothetical protein